MTRRHRELMQELRAAKPLQPQSADEWADSEQADRLLARIHAAAEAADEPKEGDRRSLAPRLAWVAGGLVLVAVVVFLALWLIPSISGDNQRASEPTMTSLAPSTSVALSKEEALRTLVALFRKHPGFLQAEPGDPPTDVRESAQFVGLVRGSEAPTSSMGQPTTRGEFALWIWRGWSLVLPTTAAPPEISDHGTLGAEELEAVDAIVALNILELNGAGAFRAADDLTSQEAARAVSRLETLLGE
jgi:hypothetical protein